MRRPRFEISTFETIQKFNDSATEEARSAQRKGAKRQLGTIKYCSPERGFGFVHPERGGASVFFDFRVLQRARIEGITPGLKVYFETADDPRRGTEWVEKVELA